MQEFTLPENIVSGVRSIDSVDKLSKFFEQIFTLAKIDTGSSTTDYGLKKSGKKYRTDTNAQCRNILARINAQGADSLTKEDIATLKQYSGKGGLDDNSQYEYYTPTFIAEGCWDLMKANGFENGNVLDPCTGAGVFSATKPGGTVITGCDLDPVSSQIAQILNPGDRITNSSFEDLVMNTEDESFDCAIGNVPFGNARGASKHKDPAYKNENLCQRYFILRALDKIRPGGLCCFVCPPDIVQNKGKAWERFRYAVSDKAEFLGAHKLPTGTFSAQGTQTVTDVVVFKKHPKDVLIRIQNKELSPDTLREALVYWQPFIQGQYWQGEGRAFIHGKYVPKEGNSRFDTDKVIGSVDNATLKKQLATRFSSRINWTMLDTTEGTVRKYVEGDTLIINGDQCQYRNGQWVKVAIDTQEHSIDKAVYGVDSYEALEALRGNPQAFLSLSLDNVRAIDRLDNGYLPASVKTAVSFALHQDEECREQIFRGAVIGALVGQMARDAEQGKDVGETRDRLQELVLAEYEKYGDPKGIKKLRLAGDASKTFGVFMNAVRDGEFSDLLAGKLERESDLEYNDKDPGSIVAYLSSQRDGEPLDFEEIKALYTGETPLEKVEDLTNFDSVAIDPASGMVTTMANYCSGDIYPKLAECRKVLADCKSDKMRQKFQAQIDEITRSRTWTDANDINFSLRNRWLDKSYILRFLEEQGYDDIKFGLVEVKERERWNGEIEQYISYTEDRDNPKGEYYADTRDQFIKNLAKYINGGNPTSSRREIINEYNDKIRILEETFAGWMRQQPEIAELEEQYNRTFNGYIPPQSDSSNLHLDNLSGEIRLHGYQNEEVRRLSNLGCGICGFGTGLGKSYTALGLAAYNLKKGKFRRTCIVVPSAVLENWYHEASQMFSEDFLRNKMFFVGLEPRRDKSGAVQRKNVLDEQGNPRLGKDGQPVMQDVLREVSNKQEIFKQMWAVPQSNFSIVVMTKEKFASIPIDETIVDDYMSTMVSRNLVKEKANKKGKEKDGESYREAKKRARLEETFSDTGRKKANELPTIDQMGFDSIITDESHFFKNSLEGGSNTRDVVFVQNAPTSQIARDMSMKSYYIRKKNGGTGVYGLTATPVTNSPLEIFNMLSLVTDLKEFESMGIDTPDRFIQFFADIQPFKRTKINGEREDTRAVLGFRQLDALRSVYHKYCNIKTVEDVDQEIHVPNKVESNEQIEISPAQAVEYRRLRMLASDQMSRDDEEKKIPVFSIIRDMDRISTDMDMFYHTITFTVDQKFKEQAQKAVQDILDGLPEGFAGKFLETSKIAEKLEQGVIQEAPEPAALIEDGSTLRVVVFDALEDIALAAFKKAGIVDASGNADVGHPIPPKYARLIANIEKYLKEDPKGKQIIFTDEKSQHSKLARILERNVNGLEPGKIGIINAEDAKGTELDRIAKAYNSGALQLVICNKKAEVGVNLQKGTVAIHHLTLPWTPASINQRNGRGVRQGNKVSNVDVYYYCGKGTFDEYRAELLKGKANWIGKLLNGDALTAKNADVTTGDDMAALLAENPEARRRMLAEEKAKEAAQAEEEKRKRYASNLGQYLNSVNNLAIYDRTTDRTLNEWQTTLANLRQAIEDGGLTEQAVQSTRNRIANIEEQIERFQRDRSVGKEKLAAAVTRAKMSIVNAQNRGEKMPFDFNTIVDNPQSCYVVPSTGLVLMQGDYVQTTSRDMWQLSPEKTYRFSFVRGHKDIITLTEVASGKEINVVPKDLAPIRKVSLSKDDIAAEKLADYNYHEYSEILESGISKERFFAIRDKVRISGNRVLEDEQGNLSISGFSSVDLFPSFPEPNNPVWKTTVLRILAGRERNNALVAGYRSFEKIFNTNTAGLTAMVDEYTSRPSDQDILNAITEACSAIPSVMIGRLTSRGASEDQAWIQLWERCNDGHLGTESYWRDYQFLIYGRATNTLKASGFINVFGLEQNPICLSAIQDMRADIEQRAKAAQARLDQVKEQEEQAQKQRSAGEEARRAFVADVFKYTEMEANKSALRHNPYAKSEQDVYRIVAEDFDLFRKRYVNYLRAANFEDRYNELSGDGTPYFDKEHFFKLWKDLQEKAGIETPSTGGEGLLDQATIDTLAKHGIELSVNEVAFSNSSRNYRYDIAAQSAFMLYDKNGYNGMLRRKSSILKAQFEAKYTTKYPPDMGKSFWIVPVNKASAEDLRKIFA